MILTDYLLRWHWLPRTMLLCTTLLCYHVTMYYYWLVLYRILHIIVIYFTSEKDTNNPAPPHEIKLLYFMNIPVFLHIIVHKKKASYLYFPSMSLAINSSLILVFASFTISRLSERKLQHSIWMCKN